MNFFVGIISHNQNHYVGSFTMQKVTTLRDKTRELLNKRSIVLTTKVIADEIGVTPSWVNRDNSSKKIIALGVEIAFTNSDGLNIVPTSFLKVVLPTNNALESCELPQLK